LDVGGHLGQTLTEVVDRGYALDKIYCFEPAPMCWPALEKFTDPRVSLCRFGLWKKTTTSKLYGAGEMGASMFPDAEWVDRTAPTTTIELVRASEWVAAHVAPGDVVFMKLNCEGAECDVVEDLLDAGLLKQFYSVMIDFDIRDVPSLRWREKAVRARLRAARLTNVCFTEDVMKGATHQDRIRHWMVSVGGQEPLPLEQLRRKYADRLSALAAHRGRRARLEWFLRHEILARLPAPMKLLAKRAWRSIVAT
jgi:FkbM family methyltransferase